MDTTQAEIRALFERQSEAMRAKDLDGLMSFYSPDVVYFDIVPPLQFVGSEALRARFSRWFDGFDGPMGVDSSELTVSVGGDIAVVHWFSRVRGTLKNGREVGTWVRATSCWQRSDQEWLVMHEHISCPVDLASGKAVTDLQP